MIPQLSWTQSNGDRIFFNIIAPLIGRCMKSRKAIHKTVGALLFVFMLSFTSCDTVPICWMCVNPHNSAEWQSVCNSMTKNKLESYGYQCTPY